ncbi:MAG: hypothetical protein IJE82_01820, partial [Alphaproteobacteria bacterium]|nr:hypothetical protein [Alphaproteobacteria bacterium]
MAQHQNFAKSITESECLEQFKDYTSTIGALAPITDSFADTSTLDIKYDLTKQQADYNECVETAEQKRKIEECESKSQYHKWVEDKCVDNTPTTAGTDETMQSETSQSETVQDANAPVVATVQLTDEELRNDPERCPREGNGLKTIDDSYKVGDSCSYGNVTVGRIFKYKENRKDGKKKGACSCTAIECKEGYEVKNGSCIEKVADDNGICLKKEIPTNDYKQCNTLCKKYADDNKCKFQQAAAVKNPLRCVCNPNSQDIDSIKKQDEKRKNNVKLDYYDVCDVDKGKAKEKGKTEVCEENVFKYIQLPAAVAQDIAEEYTTKRLNKDVKCSDKYAEHGNDDWLKCTAYDESTYYTFRFDDLEETDSDQINPSKVIAICAINSVSSTVSASTNVVGNTTYSTSSNNNPNKYMGCYGSCTNGIKETAQKLEMSAQDVGGVCWIRENTEKFFDVCNDYRGKTGGGKEECDE